MFRLNEWLLNIHSSMCGTFWVKRRKISPQTSIIRFSVSEKLFIPCEVMLALRINLSRQLSEKQLRSHLCKITCKSWVGRKKGPYDTRHEWDERTIKNVNGAIRLHILFYLLFFLLLYFYSSRTYYWTSCVEQLFQRKYYTLFNWNSVGALSLNYLANKRLLCPLTKIKFLCGKVHAEKCSFSEITSDILRTIRCK